MSGDPLDARCQLKTLQHNMLMTGLAGTVVSLRDCALVDVQGIEVVLIRRRSQAMGIDLFSQLGCDLASKRLAVMNSSQCFRAAFARLAVQVTFASAPGSVTADLRQLPYRKIRRPKWTIDL